MRWGNHYIKMCDKPILGASASGMAAKDTLAITDMLFGGAHVLKETPAVIAVASVKSPLSFSGEQADVIMEMAACRQPVIIATMVMAGFSGPVSIAGAAALQNAEILAGIVLSQLTAPGTPVEISDDAIDADLIISVGQGEYLTHPKTFAAFNSLSQPVLFSRSDHQQWMDCGAKCIEKVAGEYLQKRMETYTQPMLDPSVEKDIDAFIINRKK